MIAIKAVNLFKKYDIYEKPSHRVFEFLSFNRKQYHTEFWAIKDINFEIEKGMTIGVVGQNGSGKSTLLKIISGITYPTTGKIETSGRISALIELGTGFHQEFTGRANVYMNASLMGIDKKTIDKKFNAILDFSELHDFIDFPVKTYSSGMNVRLAFSVAINVEPDILLIDEALSVGDALFQRRCIEKIKEFQKKGVTVFFVSHDPVAIKSLCQKAILLENGSLIEMNDTRIIMDKYNQLITQKETQSIRSIRISKKIIKDKTMGLNSEGERYGSFEAKILTVQLLNDKDQKANTFVSGENMTIQVDLIVLEHLNDLTAGIMIRNKYGFEVYGTNTFHQKTFIGECDKRERIIVTFKQKLNISADEYYITVALHSGDIHLSRCFDWWDDAGSFKVLPHHPVFSGIVDLHSKINCSKHFLDSKTFQNILKQS